MRSRDKHFWYALCILAIHVALSVVYSIVVPIWEAHDEWAHYAYVEYVARNWRLPPPGERLTHEYEYDEASQPPLYYVLAALPVGLVDTSDDLAPVVNPYATRGTGEGGVNFAVHDRDIEGFPWQGTVLAVHLARFVSIVIGTIGCLATYALGRLLWPRQPYLALGALAVHAFVPQWVFINSVVTNDVLVSALGAWMLYFGVKVASGNWSIGEAVGLVLTPALAILTKYTAIGLVSFAAVALVVGLRRTGRKEPHNKTVRRAVMWAVLLALLAVCLVLWRNWQQTGHLLPRFKRQIRAIGDAGIISGLAWRNLPQLLSYGFRTFWASFGWGNVGLPSRAYWVLAAVCALATVGTLWGAVRRRRRGAWLVGCLLLLYCLAVLSLPLYQELRRGGVLLRGRYLLPALSVVALLITWGIPQLLPQRTRRWATGVLSVAVLAGSIWVIVGLIGPAYSPPTMIREEELPQSSQELRVLFDGKAELVAYEVWPSAVNPGDGVSVTLWWKSVAPMTEDYTVGVHLIDSEGNSLASRNHYPADGNYATSLWRVGDLFREVYWLELPRMLDTPAMARVSVALFQDDEQQTHLAVADARGEELGHAAHIGRVAVRSQQPDRYEPATETDLVLSEPGGGTIRLIGFDGGQAGGPLGRSVPITLYFEVVEALSSDYVVFMHLMDREGNFILSRDGPPMGGSYPTAIWSEGEQVRDRREMSLPNSLPAGWYQIAVGMYDPLTLTRLMAADSRGQRLVDDVIPLLDIEVTSRLRHGYLPYLLQ